MRPEDPSKVGLPLTTFMYHLDQVATMLGLVESDMIDTHIYFSGRSGGRMNARKIKAINIAVDESDPPQWRVTEGEFVRWLKLLGIRVFSRGKAI